jgi:superfamily I DNA/RNA helicase/RecB family exonuclease
VSFVPGRAPRRLAPSRCPHDRDAHRSRPPVLAGRELATTPTERTPPSADGSGTRRPADEPRGLTPEQRAIVEWGDGPLVVIAGAGTGKTRVIVERVRRLLETRGEITTDASGYLRSPQPSSRLEPFAGPLAPEQILVLTYNVKAALELKTRLEAVLGISAAARLAVANFHSFCNTVLSEAATDADLPAQPDVLDGVGQVLLLRDIRPRLALTYFGGGGNPNLWLDQLVAFINRAKDELVTPADFEAWVVAERRAFEDRYGGYQASLVRLEAGGNLTPMREVRKAYARLRRDERARAAGDTDVAPDESAVLKAANKEARRTVSGIGSAKPRGWFDRAGQERIDELAATYVVDGAALEILRLSELALVYRAYQEELVERGALDFGEQIAAVTQLFKRRPNVLRRYQRQYRYILVDEFQDANIAQIELVELLGRTPDRPDNVMVVGDDDQSIYRFRGASFAAFVEFDRRFSRPPSHAPDGPAPGDPPRLRLTENFRSTGNVLAATNRLIARNELRYERDKALFTRAPAGEAVRIVMAESPGDEAAAIVERIEQLAGWDPAEGMEPAIPWSDVAVLYRKHKHREEILARLRADNIPYAVSGGLSLFETAEIRDLEMTLRAIADPLQDVALVRMMSAGPWRLDAIEILQVARMAKFDRRHIVDALREVVESGELEVDRADGGDDTGERAAEPRDGEAIDRSIVAPVPAADPDGDGEAAEAGGPALQPRPLDLLAGAAATTARPPATARIAVAPETRAKLRRLLGILDVLGALTWREGPFTVLDELLTRTGRILDLVAADTLESKRTVANIASLLRFTHDWEAEHPRGTLAGFVDYLDAYQSAGGELPTSVELSEDVQGVRLMTLYQAKGLEYRYVFVPSLLEAEWPAQEYGRGLFPQELLREQVPVGDIHTEEERRLLYVAMTRAREGLMLTTHPGATGDRRPSAFVGDLVEGAGPELETSARGRARAVAGMGGSIRAPEAHGSSGELDFGDETDGEGHGEPDSRPRAVLPAPTRRERRLSLRLRAAELIGLLEGIDADDPEAQASRAAIGVRLTALATETAEAVDDARRLGLDPLTLRVVALDSAAGGNLLDVAPLPPSFSYTQFDIYERCPLQYAFRHVYRIPTRETVGALTFGSTAHAAFERFTRERRERIARGEPPPTRDDLRAYFVAEWKTAGFPDRTTEDAYRQRVGSLLDNFYEGELAGAGEALAEELPFDLAIDPADGSPAVVVHGSIDRIDRSVDGAIEVVDYKTGRISSQKGVDESLQLSIYSLACRDELGLGTPERVTLYFTESATRMTTRRTDEQLDAARDEIVARARRIRSGDFAATPSSKVCYRCDYVAMCPSRVR